MPLALSEEEARATTSRVFAAAEATDVRVSLSSAATRNSRFARNMPSTSASIIDRRLSVTAVFGTRSASASTNQLDDASLRDCVRRVETLARLAPEDPEHMPPLDGPQVYLEVPEASEPSGPEAIAAGVARCISEAADAGLVAAGFATQTSTASCYATRSGVFGFHRSTSAHFSETVRTVDATGSGWACRVGHNAADIDFAGASAAAIEKARGSSAARPLEPGTYPAILEPACVASMVQMLTRSMGARGADEGRTFFATDGGNRLGETLFGESIDIHSDPTDPRTPTAPWGSDGLARARRSWIAAGKVANLHRGRFWAKQTELAPVSYPSNLMMAGGEGGIADLIKWMERGVLITSLWYIRSVDPRTLLHTGLTRDGVFWVEDGAISHAVTNFRWNDSPIRVLAGVEALSAPISVSPRGSRSTNLVVPAVRTAAFELSSVSDAV
jgi:predicted Zn-dependent protease